MRWITSHIVEIFMVATVTAAGMVFFFAADRNPEFDAWKEEARAKFAAEPGRYVQKRFAELEMLAAQRTVEGQDPVPARVYRGSTSKIVAMVPYDALPYGGQVASLKAKEPHVDVYARAEKGRPYVVTYYFSSEGRPELEVENQLRQTDFKELSEAQVTEALSRDVRRVPRPEDALAEALSTFNSDNLTSEQMASGGKKPLQAILGEKAKVIATVVPDDVRYSKVYAKSDNGTVFVVYFEPNLAKSKKMQGADRLLVAYFRELSESELKTALFRDKQLDVYRKLFGEPPPEKVDA